ncbi:hypothetical protein ACKAV7_001916 [Fusarium commune]
MPRAAADGLLYSWPDGDLVTLDKLAAWLKEDILLQRVTPLQKKPQARGKGKGKGKAVQLRRQLEQEQLEAAALAEAESLAEALEVPLAEAADLLADDREGYVPPTALAPAAVDLAEGSLLTRGTIDAYIAAVIKLWQLQVAHGNANTENPRGAAVQGFLKQRGRQQGKHDRASFKDRGTDGIQAGYSPDEWLRVQDLLLSRAAYMPQNLRTRVDLLFGHYYLLQGENRRKIELADLSLLDYPSSEGPTPCGCLITLLQDGKLNKTAKKEFIGALRHKDPLFYTQGALAQLFFWRWHVAGEPSLSFRRCQDWYQIKVLIRRDREQELSLAIRRYPSSPMPLLMGPNGMSSPSPFALMRGILESTREAILQNSQRLAIRLEAQLEGIQDGLDALLQGKVPVTFTGHFGAEPAVSLAPAPAPSIAPTLNFNTAPAPAPEPPVPGMPVVAALAKVFTVRDVCKEWEEGIAGQPAVWVLEEAWGSRWRPGNGTRV